MKDWLPWLMVVLVGLLLTGGIFMLYIAYWDLEKRVREVEDEVVRVKRDLRGKVGAVKVPRDWTRVDI